jgi:hypothetical protein
LTRSRGFALLVTLALAILALMAACDLSPQPLPPGQGSVFVPSPGNSEGDQETPPSRGADAGSDDSDRDGGAGDAGPDATGTGDGGTDDAGDGG